MSTQKFVVAMVNGHAAIPLGEQLQSWARRRRPLPNNTLWSSEAWSPKLRRLIDNFAVSLKKHCTLPPVVYFAEWVDQWSAGNLIPLFERVSGGPYESGVAGNRFDVHWQCLPDQNWIGERINNEPQFPEDAWLQQRIREALEASNCSDADQSILILLHEVIAGTVCDEEACKANMTVPDWVFDICRDSRS